MKSLGKNRNDSLLCLCLALGLALLTACDHNAGTIENGTSQRADAGILDEEHRCGTYVDKDGNAICADLYANFAELEAAEPDAFTINSRDFATTTVIAAIHGGGIEPGSTEIADIIANAAGGVDYDFYSFDGIKSSGNSTLHITSTNFDEPTCVNLVAASTRTITIHGCSDLGSVVYVGGLDNQLRQAIADELNNAGFNVDTTPPAHLAGTSPDNICNSNMNNMGVQLEISKGMRQELFSNLNGARNRAISKTPAFYDFVNAVRAALE